MSELSGTLKSVRFTGKQAIEVSDQEPAVPGAGEVLIAVRLCGICGSDLHFYTGRWGQPQVVPGHEITGVISLLGPEVTGWRSGQRVCVEPVVACGTCAFCHRGETNRCRNLKFLSYDRDGGMASTMVVPVDSLHALPDEMSDSLGALIEPLAVGVHAARVGGVQEGDTVVVCGAGTIGLMTAVAARDSGARQVICSGRYPHQREIATHLGAVAVAPEDLETVVNDATEGLGADVVFETIGGAGQAVGQAVASARPGGAVVLVGGFSRPTSIHLQRVVGRELRILGSNCYDRARTPTDFELAIEIAASQRYRLEQLITHHLPIGEALRGFEIASDKSSGAIKVQLECGTGAG